MSGKSLLMEPYSLSRSVPSSARGVPSPSRVMTERFAQHARELAREEAKPTEKPTDKSVDKQKLATKSFTDPRVWGPPFWFSLHVSSANYPVTASNLTRELMKNRILALPIEIPCSACRPHAHEYIESRRSELDSICSGRDALFAFYVDFHNKVNERYGKPKVSYDEAKQMWGMA